METTDQIVSTPTPAAEPVAAPVAPAAPATPTPAPEKQFRTLSEAKFFANKENSSLPETPIELPPQEPAPIVPSTPSPSEPVSVTPPEDDFSVDFPEAQKEEGVLLQDPVRHPDSPLSDTAPQWQHDAFNRLQQDPTISEEDKKTISALPPNVWDKARRWNADTKLLGEFRDQNVPISRVFDILTKQSKERATEIETEAINRLLSTPERMIEFSAAHPQTYAQVMSTLITEHTDFIADVLKRKGFTLSKAQPFDVNKVLEDLKSDPLWDTFSETDIAAKVEAAMAEMAQRIGTTEVTPEDLMEGLNQQPQSESSQVFQTAFETAKRARDNQWLKAISDGLAESGIKPATPEEAKRNPAAANLKTLIYNVALHGLPGVITNWDEHSAQWGAKQPGFQETFQELASLLTSGEFERFEESSSAMNPFYYEFGKRRANIGLIQNLYRTVDKLLSTTEPAPAPTGTTPPGGTASAPAAEPRGRTLSERRFFAARGQ